MTAQAIVEQVIENAIAQANTATQSATTLSGQAQSASQVIFQFDAIPPPERPDVTLLPFNPDEDLGATFQLAFDNAVADLGPDFEDAIDDFLRWFPSWNACLKTTVDPWICNTITAGGVGLPPAIENAIWNRERERELKEVSRLQSESLNAFADRGWSLPSGVLVDEQAKIAEAGANRIAQASRDRAIKEAEIRIDMLKFAVEKGVQMRLGVLDALVNYLNTWLKIRALALEEAGKLVEAKSKLWDTSARYLHAQIAVAQLLLHYEEIKVDSARHTQRTVVEASIGAVNARVAAAIGGLNALANIAGSFASSTNSLADISHSTIGSE